jgi:hypothetical protein
MDVGMTVYDQLRHKWSHPFLKWLRNVYVRLHAILAPSTNANHINTIKAQHTQFE